MARGGGKKYQYCALGEKGCLKPTGTVTWVFCESSEQWFHCICVGVDSKKANDEDFIFICPELKPLKEKEFNALKPELKRQIGSIMDRHPVFSTALIARRCFATKSASNEYHFGRPGIPVTLRELEEKMSRDVASLDHFKHMAKVMSERMVASVKGEFAKEAKNIQTEIDKLLQGLGNANAAPPAKPATPNPVNSNTSKNKRNSKKGGNNKENNDASTEKSEETVESKPKEPPAKKVSKRGKAAAATVAAATVAETNAPKQSDNKKTEPVVVSKPEKETKTGRGKRGGAGASAAPAKKVKKAEAEAKKAEAEVATAVVAAATNAAPPSKEPEAVVVTPAAAPPAKAKPGRKPRTKKEKVDASKPSAAAAAKKPQNENVLNNVKSIVAPDAPTAKSEDKPEVVPASNPIKDSTKSTTTATKTEVPSQAPAAPKPGRGRKRKNALTPVNSNLGSTKMPKTVTTVAAKIITGSPGSPAKIAIAGSNLVNLSALSQPLPPQVVLPTTPLAAPQVQSLKSTAPPPQLIQLRPTGANSGTPGVGQTMQIRPLRAAGGQTGPRPQFFKIVGGKPVQISGANLRQLPASALGSLQPQAGRVMYMRAPVPSTTAATSSTTLSTSAALTTSTVAAAGSTGNKIILLSNKGQGITASKPGGGPPSIVRVVSPNSVTSSIGGKLTLAPGSPTKLATLRPAGSSVPILLRTVAPRPAGGSPPIQLPIAPLPKSALNNAGDKKTTSDAAASAKAIQVLLPKSPLPPTTTPQSPTNAANTTIKSPGGSTTTTTTTASGAFVWTNSTRANFKLSSRINFASLDKFKNVVNKDVHFILANIVTEDKSNEFSFRLHLKREPVKSGNKKDVITESYLELEAKAKVPTAQEWSLKVKTDPPVFLVSGGNFLADFPATRIPKDIADTKFVDYELHIDKCSPTQVATGKGSVAKMAAAAAAAAASKPEVVTGNAPTTAPAPAATTPAPTAPAPPTPTRGRKVKAK